MTTFIGFNTQNQYKKFTLVDNELVKRDLLNAFNIRQGELPGVPEYGSTIMDNLFENQTQETESIIVNEVQRICGGDPRILVDSIQLFPQQNGMLIQVEIAIVPSTVTEMLNIFFNNDTKRASYI
jgi:hypothetical protein